ncbi:hypothetical protein JAB8_17990 [Janthinobacterium sp. HH106]|nr:hypothetical protein JAB8_17990 [Janthinobacterium sp. HH106]
MASCQISEGNKFAHHTFNAASVPLSGCDDCHIPENIFPSFFQVKPCGELKEGHV